MLGTTVRSIYNPHDLQHRHFPDFFSKAELLWRESHYGAACRAANTIAVASEWVKQDIVAKLAVESSKVQVIPDTIPTETYSGATPLPKELEWLPTDYMFFPAQTWPHKNHLRLLDAMALNRDEYGLTTPLVCTGRKNDHWPHIERRIKHLHLQPLVHHIGYVEPEALRLLYSRALFMVMPTLHESVSYPVFEAFASGVPVACSSVTSLPEQCGEAAILFDPLDTEEMAGAMRLLATDANLRAKLASAGTRRAAHFSVERTARAYRALYRRVAGLSLTAEDRELLNNNWMAA